MTEANVKLFNANVQLKNELEAWKDGRIKFEQ